MSGQSSNAKYGKSGKGVKRGSSSNTKPDYRDYRFVRLELSEQERRDVSDWELSDESLDAWLDELLSAGYSLKLSRGDDGKTIHATISCDNPDEPNAGLRLSGFGRSRAAALRSCAYKDTVICEYRTWREAESERGGQYRDIG